MRLYQNEKEMYEETFREIWKRGQTIFDKTVQGKVMDEGNYEQKEIINYSYMLTQPSDEGMAIMLALAKEKFNKEHLQIKVGKVWFNDMVKNNTLKEKWWGMTQYTKKYYDKFCSEDRQGNAAYSYGERIIPKLDGVIRRLKGNIYSRGAQINVIQNKDVNRIGRRVPCTNVYHFMARPTLDGDKLNLIIDQRSCDAVNFFPLDLYKAYLLLDYVAKSVSVKPGYIIHNIHSLHVYKLDVPEEYKW